MSGRGGRGNRRGRGHGSLGGGANRGNSSNNNMNDNENINANTNDNQDMNVYYQTANPNFGMSNPVNPDNYHTPRTTPAPSNSWAAIASGQTHATAPAVNRAIPGGVGVHNVVHTHYLPPTTNRGFIETGVPEMFRRPRDVTVVMGTPHVVDNGSDHNRHNGGYNGGPLGANSGMPNEVPGMSCSYQARDSKRMGHVAVYGGGYEKKKCGGNGEAFGANNDTAGVDKAMANIKGVIEGLKIENIASSDNPSSKDNTTKKRNGNRYKKQWNKLVVDKTRNKQVAKSNATTFVKMPIVPLDPSSPGGVALGLAKRALPQGVAFSFHLFKFLPAEIRIDIWHIYMKDNPHIIEMEWGAKGYHHTPSQVLIGKHSYRRVCPLSRAPPPVFHVCSESRQEALKVHALVSFDRVPDDREPATIYFNPNNDIILFGQDSCISTIILTLSRTSAPISRVAIHCSRQLEKCCDWDDSVYGVDGGVDMFQALHGFDESIDTGIADIRGCKGLKEVNWVINSKLWRPGKEWVGKIDHTIGFRPATTNGLTDGQKNWKRYLHSRNELSIRTEAGIGGVGENKWTGDDMPKFNFVSLAPRGANGKTYDGLGCNQAAASWLAGREFAALKNIERRTGAEIVLIEREYPGENPREVGFIGSKREVARAKEMVIVKIGQSKNGELVAVYPAEAVEAED